ncbi:hypothetical protein ACFL0R_01075 [Pseudomonadota bacterium]
MTNKVPTFEGLVHMRECPKWDSCSAPLCPLDDGMECCTYLDGEAICFYVREFVKRHIDIRTPVEGQIFLAVALKLATMKQAGGAKFRKRLERARNQGSKRKAGMDLSGTQSISELERI